MLSCTFKVLSFRRTIVWLMKSFWIKDICPVLCYCLLARSLVIWLGVCSQTLSHWIFLVSHWVSTAGYWIRNCVPGCERAVRRQVIITHCVPGNPDWESQQWKSITLSWNVLWRGAVSLLNFANGKGYKKSTSKEKTCLRTAEMRSYQWL